MKRFYFFLLLLLASTTGWTQIVYSGANAAANCNSNNSTTWLTNNNWCGGVLPAAGTYAQFGLTGTAATIGINMNTATLAQRTIGGIELAAGIARTINNSSTTAANSIIFNGATIAGVPNTILRNASSNLLTIADGTTQALGVSLNNATNNIVNIDGPGGININTIISGANRLTKTGPGPGALTLLKANTYSGGTDIAAGSVVLGAAGVLTDAGQIILSGGTLKTGATAGFNETVGTLQLTASSNIALGTGSHTLTFANSSAVLWATTPPVLTITGWVGGYNGTSGTAGKIFFGSNAGGLTPTQLSRIQFMDGSSIMYPASILPTGELVPSTCITPIAQASDISSSNTGTNSIDLTWTNGSGGGRYVVINNANSFTDPVNGADPLGVNTVYAGSGEQIVFAGSVGNSVTVTGLAQGTTYYFRVYEYNCAAPNSRYNTTTATNNPNSITTTSSGSPFLSATSLAAFGNICLNAVAGPNMFTLSGGSLDGSAVTVGPLAGYTFSLTSGGTYINSINLPAYSGANTDIYVHFTPTLEQSYSGNIPASGGGVASYNIPVSGAGVYTAPTVTTGTTSGVNQVSATASGSIPAIGCTAIALYGIEYSTTAGFTPGTGTQVISGNLAGGNFSSLLTGLTGSTTYYYRAYAKNDNPTVSYGSELSFITSAVTAPTATAATAPFTYNSFTANWTSVPGATGYRLDASTLPAFGTPALATDLFISEYTEGSSSNKYVEIYNGTGASVNLSDYKLQLYANGSSTVTTDITLTGTLANGSTIVYKNGSATIYGGAATTNNAVNFNGDDAIALFKISTNAYVDIVGTIGEDPGTEWTAPGGYSTLDKTLRRKSTVSGGITTLPANGFPTLATEWDVFNIDDIANLGSHVYNAFTPSFLPGFNNLAVASTSQIVTTPPPGYGTFYYRVRATDASTTSANSNVISVTINNEATTDFRSNGSGDYSTPATWQSNVSGTDYITATQAPTATNNVLVQNGHTVTLTAAGAANGLTLASTGNIILGNNNLTTNSVTGGSSSGFVRTNASGRLFINNVGSAPILFPVGPSASLYHPATIANTGAIDNFGVRVTSAIPGCGSGTTEVIAVWDIAEGTLGGSNCALTLDYTGAATTPSFDPSQAQIIHCTGFTSDYHNGSVTGTVASGSGFTSFSPFGISNDLTVLPVNFTSIRASQAAGGIKVDWSNGTETEVVNYGVERSTDGVHFTSITSVNARLNNGARADYSFLDITAPEGVVYYRINAHSLDGSSKYSIIVRVNTKGTKTDITIYPNPVTDKQVSFQATALPKGQYTLRVINAAGQQVYTMQLQHNGGGVTTTVSLPASIGKGLYSLQLTGGDTKLAKTFMIQ